MKRFVLIEQENGIPGCQSGRKSFLSSSARQALLTSPNVSSRLIAEQAFPPPNLRPADVSGMKAGCPQIGK